MHKKHDVHLLGTKCFAHPPLHPPLPMHACTTFSICKWMPMSSIVDAVYSCSAKCPSSFRSWLATFLCHEQVLHGQSSCETLREERHHFSGTVTHVPPEAFCGVHRPVVQAWYDLTTVWIIVSLLFFYLGTRPRASHYYCYYLLLLFFIFDTRGTTCPRCTPVYHSESADVWLTAGDVVHAVQSLPASLNSMPCFLLSWLDARGKAVLSTAGDIYSFGILMFELSTGLPVHPHLSTADVVLGVVHKGLRPTFPGSSCTSNDTNAYVNLAQRCGCQTLFDELM